MSQFHFVYMLQSCHLSQDGQDDGQLGYPLVNLQKAIDNGPVEIVDLPSYKMMIFHSYVNVYQRVSIHTCFDLFCVCLEVT